MVALGTAVDLARGLVQSHAARGVGRPRRARAGAPLEHASDRDASSAGFARAKRARVTSVEGAHARHRPSAGHHARDRPGGEPNVDDHQRSAVKRATKTGVVFHGLFDDAGLGKTATMLQIYAAKWVLSGGGLAALGRVPVAVLNPSYDAILDWLKVDAEVIATNIMKHITHAGA